MTPGMPTGLTIHGGSSRSIGRPYSVCPDLPLESRACRRQRVTGYVFIDVHSLRVLPQVVEARESSGAVTLKWPLPRMLPDMPGKMLATGEAEITRWELGAEEPLTLLLLGRSLRIARDALVVRPIVFRRILIIALSHVDVLLLRHPACPVHAIPLPRSLGLLRHRLRLQRRHRLLGQCTLAWYAAKVMRGRSDWHGVIGRGLRSILGGLRPWSGRGLLFARLNLVGRGERNVDSRVCCHLQTGKALECLRAAYRRACGTGGTQRSCTLVGMGMGVGMGRIMRSVFMRRVRCSRYSSHSGCRK